MGCQVFALGVIRNFPELLTTTVRSKHGLISSADRTILDILSQWDQFKNINWIEEIEFPELTLQQTQQLLAITT